MKLKGVQLLSNLRLFRAICDFNLCGKHIGSVWLDMRHFIENLNKRGRKHGLNCQLKAENSYFHIFWVLVMCVLPCAVRQKRMNQYWTSGESFERNQRRNMCYAGSIIWKMFIESNSTPFTWQRALNPLVEPTGATFFIRTHAMKQMLSVCYCKHFHNYR